MANARDLKHMDRRIVERFLGRGILSDKEVDAFLKTLPDVESQGEYMAIPEPGAPEEDDAEDGAEA